MLVVAGWRLDGWRSNGSAGEVFNAGVPGELSELPEESLELQACKRALREPQSRDQGCPDAAQKPTLQLPIKQPSKTSSCYIHKSNLSGDRLKKLAEMAKRAM